MPIIRVSSAVEDYRLKALRPQAHQMAGRGENQTLTKFVNSRILNHLALESTDVLVDIGCGDGYLLRNSSQVSNRIGTVGSSDERERLQQEMPDVTLKIGLAQSLPLETDTASKIVCNAVLMYLRGESEVAAALGEISRIARQNATIWIGELPTVDEYFEYRIYLGDSIYGLLWHCLSKHGVRTFLGMCRKLLKSLLGNEQLVLNSGAAVLLFSRALRFSGGKLRLAS